MRKLFAVSVLALAMVMTTVSCSPKGDSSSETKAITAVTTEVETTEADTTATETDTTETTATTTEAETTETTETETTTVEATEVTTKSAE